MSKLVFTLRTAEGYLKTKKYPFDFTEDKKEKSYLFSSKEIRHFLASLNKYRDNLSALYIDAFLLFNDEQPFEIERKFIVDINSIPMEHILGSNNIEQFYTSFSPEVRYRREECWEDSIFLNYRGDLFIDSGFVMGNKYIPVTHTKTKKGEGNLVREEKEKNCSPEKYIQEKQNNRKGNIIKKLRYNIHPKRISFDNYLGNPLCIMEKEFTSKEEALNFNIQKHSYIIKEVTNDPRFKNGSIAKNGFPNLL